MNNPFGPPLSQRYFPSGSGGGGVEGNEYLFTRDVPQGVMPIGGRREGFRVTLDPDGTDAGETIVRLLDTGRGRPSREDLESAISDFVERVTHYLAHRGEAFFEIAEVEARGRDVGGLRLLGLPPGPVIRTPWGYCQRIPESDRAQLGKGKAIRIPRDKIWRLTLPGRLGGPRRHRRMLQELRSRATPTPEFTLKSLDLGKSAGYDFSVHRTATDIGVERATRRWGTIPSLFRVEGTTEFFLFSRRLAWKKSQLEIRDHVIEELNDLLPRVGIPAKVVLEGLTTPREVEEMIEKLQAGDVTVSEAMAIDDP